MVLSGLSPDKRIVEMLEIPGHPFFVGTQGHPELKSRPNRAHPLFRGLIQAAVAYPPVRGEHVIEKKIRVYIDSNLSMITVVSEQSSTAKASKATPQ